MELLTSPAAWIGLLTLTILEIVLGIDNIVFVSILSGKLKGEERERARKLGMLLAIIPRILLLLGIGWLVSATKPLFELSFLRSALEASGEKPEVIQEAIGISIRDLVMFIGGMFLIYKSVKEIHHKLEGAEENYQAGAKSSFMQVIVSIVLINIIFSLDSVITAVGMVKDVPIMIAAVVISGLFMMSRFVDKHPTVKMLALSFLVLIGVNLLVDAGGIHLPKGYTYFAMVFAVVVEMLNIKLGRGGVAVQLHEPDMPAELLEPESE